MVRQIKFVDNCDDHVKVYRVAVAHSVVLNTVTETAHNCNWQFVQDVTWLLVLLCPSCLNFCSEDTLQRALLTWTYSGFDADLAGCKMSWLLWPQLHLTHKRQSGGIMKTIFTGLLGRGIIFITAKPVVNWAETEFKNLSKKESKHTKMIRYWKISSKLLINAGWDFYLLLGNPWLAHLFLVQNIISYSTMS